MWLTKPALRLNLESLFAVVLLVGKFDDWIGEVVNERAGGMDSAAGLNQIAAVANSHAADTGEEEFVGKDRAKSVFSQLLFNLRRH